MLYTEDENVTCYKCDQEEYNKLEIRSSKLIEYMKIHLISLNQDLENALQGEGYDYLKGQIAAISHILEYANELDSSRPNMVG